MSAFGIRVGSTTKDLLTDFGVKVESAVGLGMPNMEVISAPYALMDGAQYQRARVASRVVSLVCNTSASTLAGVHTNLAALIDYINRDAAEPFYLRYTVGATTYELPCYYVGGIDSPLTGRAYLKFSIQAIALDPFWRAVSDSTATPTAAATVSSVNCLISRLSTGVWSNSRYQVTSAAGTENILCILEMPNGHIYVGGRFTEIGGVAVGNIAVWNGSTWAKPALAGANKLATDYTVRCMVTDGTKIYIGGDFTQNTETSDGFNGILSFTPGVGIDTAYHNGVVVDYTGNAGVYAIALDGSGGVYVGGLFTYAKDAGGSTVALTANIAKWTGSAWVSVCSGGTCNAIVRTLLYHAPSYQVFAGGDFTSINGTSISHIAAYTGATWTSMSTGFNGNVRAIRQGPDTVYAAGDFTAGGGAGDSAIGLVAKLAGGTWVQVGAGLSGSSAQVLDMQVDAYGNLYCATNAVTASGSTLIRTGTAVWDGAAWASLDMDLPGSLVAALTVQPLAVNGGLMVGYSYDTGAATATAITAVTNAGSAKAYPVITIARTGATGATFYQLGNMTTGDYIYLQYAMLPGETITIDLTPGVKTITSTLRGNIAAMVRGASNLGTWCLMPGANSIVTFMSPAGSGTSTITLTWRNRFWSVDG